jgi:amino acid transporter
MNGRERGFRRVLSRYDLVLYGLVLLGPTAPYPIFGIVQQLSRGHAALAYVVAMLGVLFTACSYGKMSSAFPNAGSTYTYVQRGLNEHVGFLAGWAMILDYLLIPLVSIIYAGLTAHRVFPAIPYLAWAIVFAIGLTLINVPGIRMTARAGNVMMLAMSICAVVFIGLAARYAVQHFGFAGLWNSTVLFNPATFRTGPLVLGAGVAAMSYIGIDAISTLAEDTVSPERDVAFATVLVCILQTAICVATVYFAALVWPDFASYPDSNTAIFDIGRRIGGNAMFLGLTIVILIAALASALTGQAGASRLLFGMGRDGALPRNIFAYLHPRFATPTRSIYLMGALCLIMAVVMPFNIAVEVLNFGAFAGFIVVNLAVIRHFYFRMKQRGGMATLLNLVFPFLGASVCIYLWLSLSTAAKAAGFCWLGIGIAYLAILTRGFRTRSANLELLAASPEEPDYTRRSG